MKIPVVIQRLVIHEKMKTEKGRVIRAAGGFYDVITEACEVCRCYIRGKHKTGEEVLLTGDHVEITINDYNQGVIEKILPRSNHITRPQVANINQLIPVVSAKKPFPDWNLLSRQLVSAEIKEINPVICLNKADLTEPDELNELISELKQFPYRHIITSVVTFEGIDRLKELLKNNVSVFTGPSGVGKSSLINAIQPDFNLRTADISEKGKRGRHTTRHVEIFTLEDGGLVVDSPGFTRIDISLGDEESIDIYFPEMKAYYGNCQFRNCFHREEPGCAIKKAVSENVISRIRYDHYMMFLNELESNRRGM